MQYSFAYHPDIANIGDDEMPVPASPRAFQSREEATAAAKQGLTAARIQLGNRAGYLIYEASLDQPYRRVDIGPGTDERT